MIETQHNGTPIHYSENEDLWKAPSHDFEAKTLSKLKDMLNKWSLRARRLDNVPVLRISEYSHDSMEVMATVLDDDGKSVWIIGPKRRHGYSTSSGREKVKVGNLALDTPEARAAVKVWQDAKEAEAEAGKRRREAFEAIPRATPEDFAALTKKENEE